MPKTEFVKCQTNNKATEIFNRLSRQAEIKANMFQFCCDICGCEMRNLDHYPLCTLCDAKKNGEGR